MNDFVGVDPQRIRVLADRLKELDSALGKGAPVIRRLFDDWNGTLGQTPLTQAAAHWGTDAHDMGRRADLALNLSHEERAAGADDPHTFR